MADTSVLFILAYGVGLILALWVKPIYGLYTYVAVFYLDPTSRWWGAGLPDLRWSLLAAIVTAVAVLTRRQNTQPGPAWYASPIAVILILYTLWMWIQLPWVLSPWHFDGTVLFSKYVLLFFLMYKIIDTEEKFNGFALAHVLGCFYLGWLVYTAPSGGRIDGVGGAGIDNADTLAMQLATGVVFASFLLLSNKGWKRWIVVLAIPFILNGIIQTETRGALVGLIAGGLATVYLKPKRFRRTYYALAALAVVGVIGLANQAFLQRISTLGAAVNASQQWDSSAQSRVAVFEAQLKMFRDHPFGAGHQGTTALSNNYLADRWLARDSGNRASHNTVMSILVDQGIPGIALFAILTFSLTRTFRRLKSMDKRDLPSRLALYRAMLGGALITAFGAGMFAQFLKAEVQIWCLALVAILCRLTTQWEEQADLAQDQASAAVASGESVPHAPPPSPPSPAQRNIDTSGWTVWMRRSLRSRFPKQKDGA